MKVPPILSTVSAFLVIISQSAFAGDFIRQVQLQSGLIWDYYLTSPTDTSWSPIAIEKEGTSFSLYAQGTAPDRRLYKLDQTSVGSDFATAHVSISSEDPHDPLRTRADKAFHVSLDIKNLGRQQKKIALHHQGITYDPQNHSATPQTPKTSFGWWHLTKNGTQQASLLSRIPVSDSTQAEGQEIFTAYTNTTDGHWIPLKTARIQIWPVATADIIGLTPGKTITDNKKIKLAKVSCQDLYPDSLTYIQVYRGEQKMGTQGDVLPQSVIRFDTAVPQNQTIPLGDWSDKLPDGKYTLEVLTITPFNKRKPERLSHVTFVLDRGIHTPGMVNISP